MEAIDFNTIQNLGLSVNRQESERSTDLGQDEFLELMVAQIKNQDPFEPMNNGDFISQLAEFSTVSGIEELQSSFSSVAASLTSNQSLQATSLIGHTVQARSSIGVLADNSTVSGFIDSPVSSTSTKINVYDTNGNLVKNLPLGVTDAGMVAFSWDGIKDDGTLATPGQYVISAEVVFEGETYAADTLINDTVASVTLDGENNDLILNLENGTSINFSNIEKIM